MDAVWGGVDVELVVSDEAGEGHVEFFGELDGKAGGRADGGEDGNAGHEGFLNEFKTGAAGDEEDGVLGGECVGEEL